MVPHAENVCWTQAGRTAPLPTAQAGRTAPPPTAQAGRTAPPPTAQEGTHRATYISTTKYPHKSFFRKMIVFF